MTIARRMGKMAGMVIGIVIMLFAQNASAETFTFTTTGDFDAGVKAPTTDENLGIETITDNPGIASDAFEIGSLKGDAFNTPSVDAETAKWNVFASGVSCTVRTTAIALGVLNLDVTSTVADCRAGVVGASSFTGNWDVRVKIDKTADVGATSLWELSLFSGASSFCAGALNDGLHYRDVDGNLQFYTCIDTVFLQIGTDTATPSDPFWLRITRATDTFTAFYSTNGIAWTQDEQVTSAFIPNPLFPYLSIFAVGVASITGADMDDFALSAGTVGAGGFRTIGSWTSASQLSAITENTVDVTVTYSGASANGYIDYVALYNGVTELAIDGTDRTSGTSFTSSFAIDLPATWQVRIGLAGNGAATATIASVVVETAELVDPNRCFGESVFGSVLFAIFGIIAGISIFATIYYGTREGADSLDPGQFGALIVIIIVSLSIVAALFPAFMSAQTIGC